MNKTQEFWLIGVSGAATSHQLNRLNEHGDLFVSPNTRLCTSGLAAHLSSRELAERFVEAILPVIQRRHGVQTRLEVVFIRTPQRHSYDDAMVEARIAAGAFATNSIPDLSLPPGNAAPVSR